MNVSGGGLPSLTPVVGVISKIGAVQKHVMIGLIGDYSESVPAHQAIPIALRLAAETSNMAVEFEWIPTERITSGAHFFRFNGLWCVPASPYRSMDGALLAIRHMRASGASRSLVPAAAFSTLSSSMRNILGWADAEHDETAPDFRPTAVCE
jgi:CTP synthase (UTP-ammonia lyase)